jgi:ABC-type nitrate/sulfonate/bicarbonate transport system substrate-binding protein
MMTRARASAVLCGGAALLLAPSGARSQANVTVRIATLPIESAAEVYYAKDMGFFTKAGLEVDIQTMQNGAAAAAAAVAGSVDIGYIPVDSMATIHKKNISIVVIAPANEYVSPSRNAGLIVTSGSTIREAKDLNGRTVAVAALQSLSQNAPRAWMDRSGGDSSTVKFVEIPFPAMVGALETRRVDAAFDAEPFLSTAKDVRVLATCFDAIAKRFLIGTWFATAQWAHDHPDAVARFGAAMHETAVWTNKNALQSGQILAKYTKLDPTVIATMVRSQYAEVLTPASMQPLIDVSAKYNGFAAFPSQELIYTPAKA